MMCVLVPCFGARYAQNVSLKGVKPYQHFTVKLSEGRACIERVWKGELLMNEWFYFSPLIYQIKSLAVHAIPHFRRAHD